MKSKIVLISIVILVGLVSSLAWSLSALQKCKKDNDRLETNQTALMSGVTKYKTSSGKWAAKATALTLTASEFKKSNDSLLSVIHELGIKEKRLISASQTSSHTDIPLQLHAKDSIVYVNGHTDTLKCMEYHDLWTDFSGCLQKSNFTGYILNRDTLFHVLHKIPKRFLFFKFGCKSVQLDVVSSNPHTQIVYTKMISLGK